MQDARLAVAAIEYDMDEHDVDRSDAEERVGRGVEKREAEAGD